MKQTDWDARKQQHYQDIGRKGGKARLETMTPRQRKMSARKAARARWAKRVEVQG